MWSTPLGAGWSTRQHKLALLLCHVEKSLALAANHGTGVTSEIGFLPCALAIGSSTPRVSMISSRTLIRLRHLGSSFSTSRNSVPSRKRIRLMCLCQSRKPNVRSYISARPTVRSLQQASLAIVAIDGNTPSPRAGAREQPQAMPYDTTTEHRGRRPKCCPRTSRSRT